MTSIELTAPATLPATGTASRARWRRPWARLQGEERAIWSVSLAILAILWAAIAFTAVERAAYNSRERAGLAASTAKGFSEYVGLHLLIADRMLVNSREGFARSGTIPRHELLVAEFGQMAPMLLQVAIADASGKLVASSLPLAAGVSIADRPHFRAFLEDPRDRLHVSAPVVGRVSGKMSLQLVRPVYGPAGEFAGVVVASIDPIKLQQYFGSVDAFAGEGTVVIAGRQDAIVRARFTQSGISWGQSLSNAPIWNRLANEVAGSARTRSVLDGTDRIVGFHRVADYPLVVTVSSRKPSWFTGEIALSGIVGIAFSIVWIRYTLTRLRRVREQENLIAQLRESHQREMEANQMKSNFLASISHELRTPLNAILGFSDLIRLTPQDEGNARFAELIHSSGTHLLALLNTLLDLAKIEAGRMEVERLPLDLGETVRTLVDVHRGAAVGKGVAMELEIDLPAGTHVVADTDRTKLTQVFNNVLNNAVKFTERGAVHVTAALQDGQFVVRVKDSGCGIAPERLPAIFDRFSARAAAMEKEAGTGLGLSLCRELMLLLGGTVELASTPGAGTEVTIRLPGARLAEAAQG
jgi:signal transduction histidine kinase